MTMMRRLDYATNNAYDTIVLIRGERIVSAWPLGRDKARDAEAVRSYLDMVDWADHGLDHPLDYYGELIGDDEERLEFHLGERRRAGRVERMRDRIRQAIARTATLCAYADALESGECPLCETVEEGTDVDPEGRVFLPELWDGDVCRNCGAEFSRAGAGADWDDYVPEDAELAQPAALEWADAVVRDFEERNGAKLEDLGEAWDTARGWTPEDPELSSFEWSDDGPERFGHCVAMEYLGHGVGLGDDVHYRAPYSRPATGWNEFDRWALDWSAFDEDGERDRLEAFDESTGAALFVDVTGAELVYAIRPEGSGICNAWALGAGFEFCGSAHAGEAERIRLADPGDDGRRAAVARALEEVDE